MEPLPSRSWSAGSLMVGARHLLQVKEEGNKPREEIELEIKDCLHTWSSTPSDSLATFLHRSEPIFWQELQKQLDAERAKVPKASKPQPVWPSTSKLNPGHIDHIIFLEAMPPRKKTQPAVEPDTMIDSCHFG